MPIVQRRGATGPRAISDLERALMIVEAVTAGIGAPNELTGEESRKVVTNEGASAEAYNTLPTAGAGKVFWAVVQSANGERWTAWTPATIRFGDYTTAAAGYVRSITPGSCALLVAINATEWLAIAWTGVWIVNDAVLGETTVQGGGEQITYDDSMFEVIAGLFRLKDGGVSKGKLQAAAVGGAALDAAHKEQIFLIPVEDLAADADIAARVIFALARANTIQRIGILTDGAPAGVDDDNTVVIAIQDGATNTIVSKTYNTGTQPPTSAYADLGALDGTHKILTAQETVTLTVTQGTNANMPPFKLVLVTIPTDAGS